MPTDDLNTCCLCREPLELKSEWIIVRWDDGQFGYVCEHCQQENLEGVAVDNYDPAE